MAYPSVVLKRGRERWILNGHPWVFQGAVEETPEPVEPGCIVDVLDKARRFVARGYYNPASSIRVRIMTRDPKQPVNQELLVRRLSAANEQRQTWINTNTTAYRVVHAENDFLPGLIVDRYSDYWVVQIHTLGMDRLREEVVRAIQEVADPRGIFERSNLGARMQEGLETQPVGVLAGDEPPDQIEVLENSTKFLIDIKEGQKTGFFLDQRENRLAVQEISSDRSVLNCFSYSGGFSVYAARGGATMVESVDASAPAIALARKNLAINGFDPEMHACFESNVFEFLKVARTEDRKYDMVIIDPPSFANSRSARERALRAYVRLNRQAMDVIHPGGILVSSSCSTQVSYEDFFGVLHQAATAAKRDLRIVKSHLQAADHPVYAAFPEGQYLKCCFGIVR